MSQVYTSKKEQAIPIFFIHAHKFSDFQVHLSFIEKEWLETWSFKASPGQVCMMADDTGKI